MIATLLSLAGYLLYLVCVMAPSFLLFCVLLDAFPSLKDLNDLHKCILVSICHINVLALKNFLWVALISEFHYTFPSSMSQVIAILLCFACYLVCAMIGAVVMYACGSVYSGALGQPQGKELPDWMFLIILGVPMAVMDMLLSYSDMMATLLSVACYLMCMVALSCLVLAIAVGAIQSTKIWWPELIHTSIVAITLLLLNMIWGSPFQKPSTDNPNMELVLIGYLIYIICSMVLTYNLFEDLLLLKTFIISIIFVLLDMFVKPSSVSDMIATLFGLACTIATLLLVLFLLVALSFVVFMFLHTWADILLPSARRKYPGKMFVGIVGLAFIVMKTILSTIPAEEPSILSNMKAELLGITDMIDEYRGVYMMIRYFTALAVPFLSMESRRIVSMYHLYTMAACMVSLGLLLTMPITENSASTLVTDDLVQQTITSLVNSQISKGWMEELSYSVIHK